MRVRLLALVCVLLLSACEGRERYTGTLILDGDHPISARETIDGELLILGGHVMLAESARVTGSIYLVNGAVDVNGQVDGDIALLGGRLALGPLARVEGRIHTGGGELTRSPQAVIVEGIDAGTGMIVPTAVSPSGNTALISFLPSLVLVFLSWLTVRIAPGSVTRTANAIRDYPIACIAMGVLAGLVALVLLVSMVFTLVLIPVAFLTGVALVAAIGFGWIAVAALIGRWLIRDRYRSIRPPLATVIGMLLFVLVMTLINLIPGLSGALLMLLAATALGGVLLTRFGSRSFVSATDEWQAENHPP